MAQLRTIQQTLREARDLFRGGDGWTKGALRSGGYDGEKPEYCAVGAVFESLGILDATIETENDYGEVYEHFVADDEFCPRSAAPAIVALANAILDDTGETHRYSLDGGQSEWNEALGTVESWNDKDSDHFYVPNKGMVRKPGTERTFTDVYDLFTRVAKAPSRYVELV